MNPRRQFLFFALSLAASTPTRASSTAYLHVRQPDASVSLWRGGRRTLHLEKAAFARRGIGRKQKLGDDITPEGEFHVRWFNARSQFRYFIGLDYPNIDYASRALAEGRIDAPTFQRISSDIERRRQPPQNTALGGYIGIHGLGRGDLAMHRKFHWTRGCVALDNGQIDTLKAHVPWGMRVIIES